MNPLKLIIVTMSLVTSSVAMAHEMVEPPLPPLPPVSLEHVAVKNILQDQLAQLSGRPVDEIALLMQQLRPGELAQTLGIDDEEFDTQLQQARLTLLRKALDAGFISAEQWQRLSETPALPLSHRRLIHIQE